MDFDGPHVENGPGSSRTVHAGYAEARRHRSSPWWGVDGIRTKAGGMRHLPLAEFLNAFLNAGLRLTHVAEPDEAPVPDAIVVLTTKGERSR